MERFLKFSCSQNLTYHASLSCDFMGPLVLHVAFQQTIVAYGYFLRVFVLVPKYSSHLFVCAILLKNNPDLLS